MKVKQLEKKQRGAMYMSTLINSLVGKQCIIRSDSFLGFAGKTEVSCKIVDADDDLLYRKKNKQVVKLLRIENIDAIEEQ